MGQEPGGAARVARWLMRAGLGRYCGAFAGLDDHAFRALVMQDYGRFGVESMGDRQKLFRLIKTLNAELGPPGAGAQPAARPRTPPAPEQQQQQQQQQPAAVPPNGTPPRPTQPPAAAAFTTPEREQGDAHVGLLDLGAMDDAEASLQWQVDSSGIGALGGPDPTGAPLVFDLSPEIDRATAAAAGVARARQQAPAAVAPQQQQQQQQQQHRPPSRGTQEPATSVDIDSLPKIRVVVRKRPLSRKEEGRREEDIVAMRRAASTLTLYEPKIKVDLTRYTDEHEFVFDDVFDEHIENDAVYQSCVAPLVPTIFKGGKVTCFAYGQTGSGKTHTMQPLPIRAGNEIVAALQRAEYADLELWVSFFEIYGGKVFDLLNGRRKLCIREDAKRNTCVVGLQEYKVDTLDLVAQLIEHGNAARSTGSTGANSDSSRSHAILQLALKRQRPEQLDANGRPRSSSAPAGPKVVGKFSFIDLAGSERGADTTDNDRQTRLEGAEINKSLLALKECIRALDHDRNHIPFRGSKLTEVLRDSFVGSQSRTVMIAAISPASGSCEHTLNTLRYAYRVKELRAQPGNPAANPAAAPAGQQQQQREQQQQWEQQQREKADGARTLRESMDARTTPFQPREANRQPPPASARGQQQRSPVKRSVWAAEAPQQEPQQEDRPQRIRAPSLTSSNAGAGGVQGLTALSRELGSRSRSPTTPAEAPPADAPPPPAAAKPAPEAAPPVAAAVALPEPRDEEDAQLLLSAHDELMNTILEEEEEVIAAHRRLIDDTMEQIKREMALLEEVDRPGSAIDSYVAALGEMLQAKAAQIVKLQERLSTFERHLAEEDILSRTCGFRQR